MSQPFCVDQLNPPGNSRLFLRGKMEIYKQIWRKQICRRRHLLPVQPVTLVRTFPLKLLLKMKAKIPILKLPVMIHHQSQKAMQRLSPQEFNDDDKVKADQVVILIKLLKTTTRNGSLVVFARRRKGDQLNKD